MLKTFFSMFDSRVTACRELKRAQNKSQRQALFDACAADGKKSYLDARHTAPLVKMVLGIRRHLLGEKWTFIPRDSVSAGIVVPEGEKGVFFLLPALAGNNKGGILTETFFSSLDNLDHHLRDFRYGRDSLGSITLRYARSDFGNEFILWAMVEGDESNETSR